VLSRELQHFRSLLFSSYSLWKSWFIGLSYRHKVSLDYCGM